jgi:serine/threonine protein phosphatase PrpC
MGEDADVAAVIAAAPRPQEIVDTLIAKARAAGGVDNVTVVVARVPSREDGGGVRGLVSRLFGR